MTFRWIFICFILFLCIEFFSQSTVLAQKKYYRGNTHTHCYPASGDITDTSYTGALIVSQYQAKGYDFLVFTDHGAWWNAKVLTTSTFTVINGSEPGISGNGLWGHFTAVNLKSRISGAGLTHQQMINAINAQGAVAFINHPRYSQIPITAQQIINDMQTGLNITEMYNGVTVGSSGTGDIVVWDSILSTGRKMYGAAADDSHKESNQGKGWIMVYASSINTDTLTEAIRRGDFYSSNGAVIDSVSYSSQSLYVKSRDGVSIKFIGNNGSALKTVNSAEAKYDILGNEVYVRAEVTNASGKKAWTQPIMTGINGIDKSEQLKNDLDFDIKVFPNPFNPAANIAYTLKKNAHVRISVYDILGHEIRTLVDAAQSVGNYTKEFDASRISAGVYICEIRVNDQVRRNKMICLK